jgi:hypothetical protein
MIVHEGIRLPGFKAEAAIQKAGGLYRTTDMRSSVLASAVITPAIDWNCLATCAPSCLSCGTSVSCWASCAAGCLLKCSL